MAAIRRFQAHGNYLRRGTVSCNALRCGKAGEAISLENRIGVLDRKLRIVNENTTEEDDWLKWAYRALQSTYGFEFQGDNVLIARVNLLMTFEEHLQSAMEQKADVVGIFPSDKYHSLEYMADGRIDGYDSLL